MNPTSLLLWLYVNSLSVGAWILPTTLNTRRQPVSKTRCFSSTIDPNAAQTGEPFPYAPQVYQGAWTYNEMLTYLTNRLVTYGYQIPQTLCGTSLCGDEMNRPLEKALSKIFNSINSLGGLAGFPFGGVTSFKKMKTHIPDGGNCVIVYGPHVGISLNGRIGHVDRANIQAEEGDHTLCCRSAILAADQIGKVFRGEAEPMVMDPMDASQFYVGNMLQPYAERLEQAGEHKMFQLPYALYEAQTDLMQQIIQEGSQFGFPGNVAVFGGIQINTPPGYLDYFVPMRFDLYGSRGEYLANMFEDPQ